MVKTFIFIFGLIGLIMVILGLVSAYLAVFTDISFSEKQTVGLFILTVIGLLTSLISVDILSSGGISKIL